MSAEMWTGLAALCETVPGADRDLDAAVWWSVDKRSAERSFWNAAFGLPRPLGDDFGGLPVGLGRLAVVSGAPPYTSSVNAVLALIAETLPGWRVKGLLHLVEHRGGRYKPTRWNSELDHLNGGGFVEAEAGTPALALLAAVCRAKAAQTEAGGSHGR